LLYFDDFRGDGGYHILGGGLL